MINQVFIALNIMIMVFLAVGLTAYGNDRPPFVALWMRSRLFATGLFVCMVIVYAQVFGYPLSLALCTGALGIGVSLGTWRQNDR